MIILIHGFIPDSVFVIYITLSFTSKPAGLHRHHTLQDAEEDSNCRAQELQDLQDPTVLHEESEVHATEFSRQALADHTGFPEA